MTRRRERLGSGIRQDEYTKIMNIPVDIFLLSILASFIQRTTGFGFGIFIMTALPLLLPSYGEATTLSGMLAMTTSLIVSLRKRKYLNWHHLLPILITFLFISTIAIFCLKHIDDAVLRRILGMVLILTSIYFAFFNTRIKLKTNIPTQVCAGTLSGLMGGFFGMQGPPAVLYFLQSAKDKNCYMALAQTYFFLGNLSMLIFRAFNGFLTRSVGWGYLYGVGGVAIGMMIGGFVFEHLPARAFRYVVYGYIGISGLIFLLTTG